MKFIEIEKSKPDILTDVLLDCGWDEENCCEAYHVGYLDEHDDLHIRIDGGYQDFGNINDGLVLRWCPITED